MYQVSPSRTVSNTGSRNSLKIFMTIFAVFAVISGAMAQLGTSPWTAPVGSYTVPAGVTSLTVTCYGGGGGGGGCYYSSFTDDEGGGGGGGGCSVTTFSVTPGDVIVVAVGAGGSQGSNSGGNGGAGGTSSVTISGTTYASASGGAGGRGANNNGVAEPGGVGGTGGTGTWYTGGTGGTGYLGGSFDDGGGGGGGAGTNANGANGTTANSGNQSTPPPGGVGGATGGGTGGTGGKSPAGGSAGTNGSTYGGGGGGASVYNSGGAKGGAGAAGAVIITYTVSCTTPTITSFSPSSACSGSGATITINGANYVNGSTTVTINGVSATPVTYINSGQVTVPLPAGATGTGNIVVTTTCPDTSSTTFTVDPTPALASQSTSTCSGVAFSYTPTGTVPGGTTYAWATPALGTGLTGGVSGTGQTTVNDNLTNTTAAPVTATYSVTPASGSCTGSTFTVTVTVNAPVATIASQSTTACSAVAFSYTPTGTITGGTTYAWAAPSLGTGLTGGASGTGSATVTGTLTNTTTAAVTATYSVTPSLSGCTGSAFTVTVTVNTVPATPGTISGTTTFCNGNLDTFSVAAVGGATSYTWSLPGGWTGTSTTDSIIATAGTAGGTVSVTANNTCGSSGAAILAVTPNSVPPMPGTMFGRATECSGALDTFAILPVTGATSYTWSLPGGWTTTGSVINAITGLAGSSGTVSVTANNACGSSAPQILAVVVTSPPASLGSISGRTPLCSGSLDTFSVAAVSGATTYTWSLPGGWTGSSTTDTIIATAGTSGGTVSVTAGNSCGTTSAQILTITVNSVPATPGNISGTATFCNGNLDTFSVAAVSGATSYTWSLPGGWTGTSTTDSIRVTAGTTAGTVSVKANNGCGSSVAATLAVTANSAPPMPGTMFGRATECSGALDTFAILPVTGATSYTWSLPGGWTTTGSVINAITGLAGSSGTVSVTANSACGSSAPQTLAVTVVTTPATPGIISGITPACSGSLDTFSIAAVNGATSYIWTLPNGWTGTSTTNTIVATAGTSGGNVTVIASNGCGNSTAQILAVTTGAAAPATPGTITSRSSGCSLGSIDTFSVAPVSGATSYTWTLPGGWTGTSATNTIITTLGATGGTVSVTANDACGSSAASLLSVTVGPSLSTPGPIIGTSVICSGRVDTFSIAPVSGASSYTWTLPNGWIGTSTTNTIIVTTDSTAGYVTVVARNGCGSSVASTLPVSTTTIVPPTPGLIGGPDNVCVGSRDSFYVTPVARTSSYTWTLPNGWTGTSTTNNIIAIAGATGGIIAVTAQNGCGTSSARVKTDTVNPLPVVVFDFAKNPVCDNSNIVLNTGTPPGGTYSGQGVSGNTFFNASTLSPGNYVLTYAYTSPVGCTASDTANFEVINCTGIENTEAGQISVFPNPFTDAITINTNGNYGNGTAILNDATGREVRRMNFNAGVMNVQMNTTTLAGGIYMLSILAEGKLVAVKKLIRTE